MCRGPRARPQTEASITLITEVCESASAHRGVMNGTSDMRIASLAAEEAEKEKPSEEFVNLREG